MTCSVKRVCGCVMLVVQWGQGEKGGAGTVIMAGYIIPG